MNGFRGNLRSAGPGKKERKAKAYHHDEACRCSAPFLKLHYNDCPVLTKPCPVHGNVFNRNVKQEKAGKKQNVKASNNPGSKTERLFRPVKSLLTVCDPETRFNFRYNTPRNSSSHETIKQPTDSDNIKTNLNKRFVEKAKPFVAGQTNKIKKLKQCFHSPCSSILNRSRSQAFVKEKSVQGDFYNGMPEMPPDEKKYDSAFKWFPTGKLNFKTSDKKTGCTTVSRRESHNDNSGKIFGCALKSKKEMKNSDSIPIFDKSIPVFGFPKEATQFVYSSFTMDDPKKKTRDGKAQDQTKRNPKEKKAFGETAESSLSDQTPSSSDDSESIYFVPFIVQPVGKKSQEEASKKPPTRAAMTQTSATDFPVPSKAPPQDEVKKDLRNAGVQTEPQIEETVPKHTKKDRESQKEERPKEVIVVEPSTSDRRPEAREERLSDEDVYKQPSAQSYEIRLTGRDSDATLYYDLKSGPKPPEETSRTTTPEVEEKQSAEPRQTASRPKESHDRAIQTLPPKQVECTSHSQQTSFQEEVSIAISDLAQIKDIICEYFKRTQPGFESSKDQVDHQTMTDGPPPPQQRSAGREPTTSRRKSSPAQGRAYAKSEAKPEHKPEPKPETRKQEFKPAVRPKSHSCVAQSESRPDTQGVCKPTCHTEGYTDADYRCIHVDDLERAAVFCICSVCGREIKRFSINISRNSEDNQPLYHMQDLTDGTDVYSEMFEVRTTRTKVSNAEVGKLADAAQSSTTQKAIRRRDSTKLSAYEVWSSPPSSSAREPSKGKLNGKPEQSDGKKSSAQSPRDVQRYSTGTPKEKYRDKDGKPRTRSSEFYYPVIIKPLLSRQFTKILEKKFQENASEESDGPTSKQKRTYDKYLDPTDIPAGKKIKHGSEEHSRDCCLREKPDFTDSISGKYEGRMRKSFATALPSSNEHFCERHFSKHFEDKLSKSPSRVKSLSLGSLNNLFSSKSCHLKSIPVGCEDSSFRDIFEFGARKSVRFLKANDGGILYHPWPSGVLAYEADEGSASSLDDKKLQTTSRENSPNEEDCCKCTCCLSDSSDSPWGFPMKDIVEEPDECDWDSHPRRQDLNPQRRKSRSFPGYTQGNTNSEPGGPFWFGRDQKRK